MTSRTPLVNVNGQIQQLQSGDLISSVCLESDPVKTDLSLVYSYVQNQLIRQIRDIVTSPSNIKLLCFSDAVDHSGNALNGTISGTPSGGSTGLALYKTYDSNSKYIEWDDNNLLSFGNSSADSAFSLITLLSPTIASSQMVILGKWDATTGSAKREYQIYVDSSNKLIISCYDQSAAASISKTSDSAQTAYNGAISVIGSTYSGNSAHTGLNLYINGSSIAATGALSGTYTAMENNTAKLATYITKTDGNKDYYYRGNRYVTLVVAEELTAAQMLKIYNALMAYASQL